VGGIEGALFDIRRGRKVDVYFSLAWGMIREKGQGGG
jgi:hypothetical protein